MISRTSIDSISEEQDTYEVKNGDTLYAIASSLSIPLARILHLNSRINPHRLKIGKKIQIPRIEKKIFEEKLIDFREIKEEQDRLNILPFDQMIHGFIIRQNIDETYIVEDKKNHILSVFKKWKLLFSCPTNSWLSGEDYMTKVFTTKSGKLMDKMWNMSTPAGIFSISWTWEYHGAPSFTRANKNGDIASSMHMAPIIDSKNPNRSNGCTRIATEDLRKLALYIRKWTRVFILPEKEGSRFFIRNGEINFTAENPYWGSEKWKEWMKDYTTSTPHISKDIRIESGNFKRHKEVVFGWSIGSTDTSPSEQIIDTEESDYGKFVAVVESRKWEIQKDLGINNDTYNDIAKLACAIALQESKFWEAKRYKLKNMIGDNGQDFFQKWRKYARREWGSTSALMSGFGGILGYFSEVDTEANSKWIAQVKIDAILAGKNEKVKTLFKKYNIDRISIESPEKSAVAIMLLLWSMITHEVPQIRWDLKKLWLNDIDALIYMNQWKKSEITKGTATPEKNQYLQRVRTGMKEFQIFQKEKITRTI